MADIFGESSGDDDEEIVPAAPYPPATQMRSRHWRSITLHVTDTQRVTFPALTFDSAPSRRRSYAMTRSGIGGGLMSRN